MTLREVAPPPMTIREIRERFAELGFPLREGNVHPLPTYKPPTEERREVAAHEAGHAAAMLWFSFPIRHVDLEEDRGVRAHVAPGPLPPLHVPEEIREGHLEELIRWSRSKDVAQYRRSATVSRMGGLVAGQPWDGIECSSDRKQVRALCPQDWDARLWDRIITSDATQLLEDKKFRSGVRALSAWLDREHDRDGVIPGDVVSRVVEDAYAVFEREHPLDESEEMS